MNVATKITVKGSRIFVYGILGGAILTIFLCFVSWKWQSEFSFRVADARFGLGLWDGSIMGAVYRDNSVLITPVFEFTFEEHKDYKKESINLWGQWHSHAHNSSRSNDIFCAGPIWIVMTLVSILGMTIAFELSRNKRSVNAVADELGAPFSPGVLPSAEQGDDGVRNK